MFQQMSPTYSIEYIFLVSGYELFHVVLPSQVNVETAELLTLSVCLLTTAFITMATDSPLLSVPVLSAVGVHHPALVRAQQ